MPFTAPLLTPPKEGKPLDDKQQQQQTQQEVVHRQWLQQRKEHFPGSARPCSALCICLVTLGLLLPLLTAGSSSSSRRPVSGADSASRKKARLPAITLEASLHVQRHRPSTRKAVEAIAGPTRTVIVTQVTSDYLDLLQNWYTSVQRLGYGRRVLFIADDVLAYRVLREKWPEQTLGMPQVWQKWPMGGTSSTEEQRFTAVVARRPTYLSLLLAMNVTVLYTDADTLWLEDPFEFLKDPTFDVVVQEDGNSYALSPGAQGGSGGLTRPLGEVQDAIESAHSHADLCAGFMLARPTKAGIRLVHRWAQGLRHEAARAGRPVSSQVLWNMAVLGAPNAKGAIGVLPRQHFPSGCVFFGGEDPSCQRAQGNYSAAWKSGQARPVVVHSNWIAGRDRKILRFKERHLWLVGT